MVHRSKSRTCFRCRHYEVSITRKFKIRLNNLASPEKNTTEGKLAKKFVRDTIEQKTQNYRLPVTLFIPSNNPLRLMDFNSFERIVGEIWVDDENLSDIIKYNKHGKDYIKY